MLFTRGWCWPTEGDATALLETSKYMVEGKTDPEAAGVDPGARRVRAGGARGASAAYDKSGRKPDAAAFEAKDAKDLRGAPAWDDRSAGRERT